MNHDTLSQKMGIKFEHTDIEFGVVVVTPQLAERLLKTSTGNRKITRRKVDAMARDMKNGLWKLNGEMIVFNEFGQLKEGHHRLTSVVKANVAVPMTFAIGVKKDDSTLYDISRARTFADTAKINGFPASLSNTNAVALCRFHVLIQKNIQVISEPEYEAFAIKHENLINRTWYTVGSKHHTILKKTPVLYAVFCALACGASERQIARFAQVAATGVCDSAEESSAIKLREYILTHKAAGTIDRISLLHATEKAIKDFIDKRPRSRAYKESESPVYSNQRIVGLL